MRDAAYVLARARAASAVPGSLSYVDGVERSAHTVGRRLAPLRDAPPSAAFALGWHDTVEPDPDTAGYEVQRLAPSALATLAACVACCWSDAERDLHPSAVSTVGAVLAAAARLGVDRIWAKAALVHDLPGAGFVTLAPAPPDDEVRLGPAFAAWPAGQVSLLRRAHDRFRALREGA
jgi:hypothetical protein